jgi:chemotaxis protein MotB
MSADKCECEEGLPEWIMSYADMITILMAFFVVMYSMAGSPDKSKEEAIFKSLRNQFGAMVPGWMSAGRGTFIHKDSKILNRNGTGTSNQSNKNSGGADRRAPQGEQSRVYTLRPGEQSAIGGVVYFAENSSEMTKPQEQQLQTLAEEMSGKPQKIEIRGHTSRRPLAGSAPYRDHWDLAYSRCRHTMEYLESLGIDPKRFRLSVAAENEPAPGGVDAMNRGLNSRVEVFLLNEVASENGVRSTNQSNNSTEGENSEPTDQPVK